MDLTGLLQKKELRCLLVNHKNLSLPNNIYKSGKSSRSRCVWSWSCQSAGGRGAGRVNQRVAVGASGVHHGGMLVWLGGAVLSNVHFVVGRVVFLV
jgi:hypothetical protein